jgi:hypothetical protein
MKKLIVLLAALLATACQVKSEDPVTTTTGHVPLPSSTKPITVQWSTATGVVQGYKIEVSIDGSTYLEQTTVDASFGGLVLTAPVGQKYWFRVRAYNQGGNSAYGPVQTIQL